jgi:arylsulfatase
MNLVLICTDQQRRDGVGCSGNPAVETPRLDGLASQGLRFERAYVANPICMPNRMSLFTGCYPRNHGTWTNGLIGAPELPLLSQVLADNGYETGSIGKLHFMPYGGGDRGWESAARWDRLGDDFDWHGPYGGFGHVELSIGHTSARAHYGRWFREHGGTDGLLAPGPDEVRPLPEALHDSVWVGERSASFIRAHQDRPFFLFASFPDPHHPFDPPRSLAVKYAEKDRAGALPGPIGGPEDLVSRPAHYAQHFRGGWHRRGPVPEAHPSGPPEDVVRRRRSNTAAMIELIDRGVGSILDALDECGLADDTLVVFTSDHGELLGDHGLWYKGPFFYEGLLGVPLIVRGPGVRTGTSSALVSTIDLMPTLLDMLGVSRPPTVDGRSIAGHLRDAGVPTRARCLVEYRNGFGEADRAAMALITDTLKYVRYEDGARELTDLGADPEERRNCEADPLYTKTVHEMEHALFSEVLATGARWPEQISHA